MHPPNVHTENETVVCEMEVSGGLPLEREVTGG